MSISRLTSFRYRTPRPRAGVGFSLVELLVVIVIFSILALLTVAVVGRVRGASLNATCAQNLRSLALAGRLYAADNGGRFTSTQYYNGPTDRDRYDNFMPGFREYVELMERRDSVDSVFTCPRLQETHRTTGYAFNHNYAINRYATDGAPRQLHTDFFSVPEPSIMAYFMDGYPSAPNEGNHYFNSWVTEAERRSLVFPHNGRVNVSFLDGHVSSMTRDEMLKKVTYDPFWLGSPR